MRVKNLCPKLFLVRNSEIMKVSSANIHFNKFITILKQMLLYKCICDRIRHLRWTNCLNPLCAVEIQSNHSIQPRAIYGTIQQNSHPKLNDPNVLFTRNIVIKSGDCERVRNNNLK